MNKKALLKAIGIGFGVVGGSVALSLGMLSSVFMAWVLFGIVIVVFVYTMYVYMNDK